MKRYTVVYLADSSPPSRILMLKRASEREFAPGMYTGIGGKIEEGENALEGALRELREETDPPITEVTLYEFGQLVLNGEKQILHYFLGICDLPEGLSSPEGTPEIVSIKECMEKDIIPTTRVFMERWMERGWRQDPFTVYVEREDPYDIFSPVLSVREEEGLGIKESR